MRKLLLSLLLLAAVLPGVAQDADPRVKRVYAIFKTHLDIGFTDLSSNVEQRYIDLYIPKAIAVAEELRRQGGEARYVWTTGSWLVDAYLKQASPEAVRELEAAIHRGDIVWNGVPYTVESESMNNALFAGMLKLTRKLDARFDRHTIAAKMTDVPGHTRSIVPLLADAGIGFLHVGTNPAVTVPEVPAICRWRDPSGKEIVLMYQNTYGSDTVLPDGQTAVSINLTGDNNGPHTVPEVKAIFAGLRKCFPNAQIHAVSLNDVAAAVDAMRDKLPVLTSEIGDTWIYGYGSSPLRMARFRALGRLYAEWIRNSRLDADSDAAVDFAVRLGMIAEHTWGADVKSFLKSWDKYDFDAFTAARSQKEFRFMEQSWKELDDNIEKAIARLPVSLRSEAEACVRAIGVVACKPVVAQGRDRGIDDRGRYAFDFRKRKCLVGSVAYQSFSTDDYRRFQDAYLTSHVWWATADNGKPGLENSSARSAVVEAQMTACDVTKERGERTVRCALAFPADERIDARVLPGEMQLEYRIASDGRSIDATLTIVRKPANRMPEAYWFSFCPEGLTGVVAQKAGGRVDLLDVVPGGNRQMHGIDEYVDLLTPQGALRVWSLDAPLVVVGERDAINFSKLQPDLSQGVHFCLFNNLWGTNFSMWWEGSLSYRFRMEIL